MKLITKYQPGGYFPYQQQEMNFSNGPTIPTYKTRPLKEVTVKAKRNRKKDQEDAQERSIRLQTNPELLEQARIGSNFIKSGQWQNSREYQNWIKWFKDNNLNPYDDYQPEVTEQARKNVAEKKAKEENFKQDVKDRADYKGLAYGMMAMESLPLLPIALEAGAAEGVASLTPYINTTFNTIWNPFTSAGYGYGASSSIMPWLKMGDAAIHAKAYYDAGKQLVSDEGVRKTYDKFNKGDILGGVKSGVGDLFDGLMLTQAMGEGYKGAKQIYKNIPYVVEDLQSVGNNLKIGFNRARQFYRDYKASNQFIPELRFNKQYDLKGATDEVNELELKAKARADEIQKETKEQEKIRMLRKKIEQAVDKHNQESYKRYRSYSDHEDNLISRIINKRKNVIENYILDNPEGFIQIAIKGNPTKKEEVLNKIPISYNGINGYIYETQSGLEFTPVYPDIYSIYGAPYYNVMNLINGKIPTRVIKGFIKSRKNDENLTRAIRSRLLTLKNDIGDLGEVVGSTVTIANEDISGIPHDHEILTTQANLEELKRRLGFVQTGTNTVGISGTSPKYGNIDINILPETNGGVYGKQVEEYLSGLLGEDFRAYKHSLINDDNLQLRFPKIFKDNNGKLRFSTNPLQNENDFLTPQEFLTLIKDENATRMQLVQDMFTSVKEKHANRGLTVMLNPEKVDLVKNIIERKGKALFGNDYKNIRELYPHLDLTNIEQNKKFLKELGFVDYQIEEISKNPQMFENVMNEWLIEMESVTRGVTDPSFGTGKDAMLTNFALKGGSYSGPGGNTLNHRPGGADMHVNYTGIMRVPIVKNSSKVVKPIDLVNEIRRQSNDVIGQALNTPEGLAKINKVLKANGLKELNTSHLNNIGNNFNQWTDIIKDHVGVPTNADESNKLKKIISEIADEFGVTAIRTNGYEQTYVGMYDIPTVSSMKKTESTYRQGYEPGNIFQTNRGQIQQNTSTLYGVYDEKHLTDDLIQLQKELDTKGKILNSSNKPIAINPEVYKRIDAVYNYLNNKISKFPTISSNKSSIVDYGSIPKFNELSSKIHLVDGFNRYEYQLKTARENLQSIEKRVNELNKIIEQTSRNPDLMSFEDKKQLIERLNKMKQLRWRLTRLKNRTIPGLGIGAVGVLGYTSIVDFKKERKLWDSLDKKGYNEYDLLHSSSVEDYIKTLNNLTEEEKKYIRTKWKLLHSN